MDDDVLDEALPPPNINTFRVPHQEDLQLVYEVYKPAAAIRFLKSEHNRTIFAEAFIENELLGTLADLSVEALAKLKTPHISPLVRQDELKLRTHYDSLDINAQLEDCYFVDDMRFWRRMVLSRTKDPTLCLKKLDEYDWKKKGISMKYTELVESCPVEYWPEEKMALLAGLIKDYVEEINLRRLQSLRDRIFEQYINSDSDGEDAYSESSESIEISDDEPSTEEEILPQEENENDEEDVKSKQEVTVTSDGIQGSEVNLVKLVKSPSQIKMEQEREERRKARHARNAVRQALRIAKAQSKAEREERHRGRFLRHKPKESTIEVEPKKPKRKRKIKNVFDIEVEPEPDDGEAMKLDKRNIEKMYHRWRNYNYPPEHCHHIDLSFIRWFNKLKVLTIEFQGPEVGYNFHQRHLKFSYDDMTRLAKGLKTLPCLKVFRLRNSSMDTRKLQILTSALKYVVTLEEVDFGFCGLKDDCGPGLSMLFEQPNVIKSLELEENKLSANTMDALSVALRYNTYLVLEYLGLSGNPLTDRGIDALVSLILATDSIKHLKLNNIKCTAWGFVRYIGNILLRNKSSIIAIDMIGIPIEAFLGRELIKALHSNTQILHFDCRQCGLDDLCEYEAALILKRNKYILNNPYIGDNSKTEEEINEFISNKKHPLMTKVLEYIRKQENCIYNLYHKASPSVTSVIPEEEASAQEPVAIIEAKRSTVTFRESDENTESEQSEKFVYDPNTFDIPTFLLHADRFGPQNRYYYFLQNRDIF